MASTFTTLGIEKMATGENAGTWGDKTNTNLDIVNTALSGYVEQSIAGGADTTALAILDGAATSVAQNAVIKLTGSITGNQIVTVPDSVEKVYIITNGTSGAYTVQFKTVSGTGVTFSTTDKGTKFFFSDGTNINEIISSSVPADNISTGDAASSFATSSGAVLIDSQASTATVDGHTGVTIQSSNSGDITLDSVADIVLDAAGNDWSFKAGGTEVLKITNSSSDVIIRPVVDAKDIIFQQRDGTEVARIEDAGTLNVVTGKLAINATAIAATAAELNIMDGGTSATSTTLVDADRLVANDNGTMVQVAMTDVKTYIGGGTSWQAVKTGNFTAAAGQGVFANTTSSAFTVTLPAGTIGDEVSIIDYAGTADSNNITIAANGSEKIHGSTDNLTVATERAAFTLVFTDGTQGWLLKDK